MTTLSTIKSSVNNFCTQVATKANALYTEGKLRATCSLNDPVTRPTALKVAMFGISILSLGAAVASFLAGAGVISLAGIVGMSLSSAALHGIGASFLFGAIALPSAFLFSDEACKQCQDKLQHKTIELVQTTAESN